MALSQKAKKLLLVTVKRLRHLMNQVQQKPQKSHNQMYNLCIIGLGNPSPKYDNSRHNIGKDWVLNVSRKFFIEFNDFEKYGYSLKSFKPQNFREIAFAGYGRDFKVDLFLKDIELITE